MSDVFCVTDRSLCKEDITVRIEKLAGAKPAGIILRDKESDKEEYRKLAEKTLEICKKYSVTCILHGFAEIAEELGCASIHLPLNKLRCITEKQRKSFSVMGASCHSEEEAAEAEKLGCTYIVAGHVFDTSCKQGIPGRGIDFLENICKRVTIPVYAIGGICAENAALTRRAGAAGVCVMRGAMQCKDTKEYLDAFKEEKNETQQ